jgi:hypothetical protein
MPTPRYTSREQIMAAIDKTITTGKRYIAKAAEMDRQADVWFKSGENIGMAKDFRDKAEYKRKMGFSLIESKARKLGEKLSEFMTVPMTDLIVDGSVSARLKAKPQRPKDAAVNPEVNHVK